MKTSSRVLLAFGVATFAVVVLLAFLVKMPVA